MQSAGARDYDELRKLIDNRRIELRMRMLDVDMDAGLQNGYFAKLMCGLRIFGPKTLGNILKALDAEIALVPRLLGTKRRLPHFSYTYRLKKIGQAGGRIARSRYTDAEWSKFCRRAAQARWAKAGKSKSVRKHNATAG